MVISDLIVIVCDWQNAQGGCMAIVGMSLISLIMICVWLWWESKRYCLVVRVWLGWESKRCCLRVYVWLGWESKRCCLRVCVWLGWESKRCCLTVHVWLGRESKWCCLMVHVTFQASQPATHLMWENTNIALDNYASEIISVCSNGNLGNMFAYVRLIWILLCW